MQECTLQKEFLFDENQIFYGVSLGTSDSETHSNGVSHLKDKFYLNVDKQGIDSKIMYGNDLHKYEDNDVFILTTDKKYKDRFGLDDEDFFSAWNESDFYLATKNKNYFAFLKLLYLAFLEKKLALTFILPDVPVSANAPLSLLLVDKTPNTIKEELLNLDKSVKELKDYIKKIDLTDLYNGNSVKKLAPIWIDYEDAQTRERLKKKINTEYDIILYMEFKDQSGIYKVETIINHLKYGEKLTPIKK